MVKWSDLYSNGGKYNLVDFARGHISRDEMIGLYPQLRKVIRERGVNEVRNLVRKAMRRQGEQV